MRSAYRLIIHVDLLDICAELFEYPTRGSKYIERTRKRDEQADGRTDIRRKGNRHKSPCKRFQYNLNGHVPRLHNCITIREQHHYYTTYFDNLMD